MSIDSFLNQCKNTVEQALKERLPLACTKPYQLHEAMRYSVLKGGKRIRTAVLCAVGQALDAPEKVLIDASMAIEMVHAFSLIHDDLPALDNDDLRRGLPSCHKAFGEATAILAGDALHSLSFEILAQIKDPSLKPESKIQMIQVLAEAIGSKGMIGGEELDIKMPGTTPTVEELEEMYYLKTGALIRASLLLGAFSANCMERKILSSLEKFAQAIGIAFQIHDDIIGIESDTEILGKRQSNDLDANKPVYPLIAGMKHAKDRRDFLFNQAVVHLKDAEMDTSMLQAVAEFIIERNF